jgi:hypothetical protein
VLGPEPGAAPGEHDEDREEGKQPAHDDGTSGRSPWFRRPRRLTRARAGAPSPTNESEDPGPRSYELLAEMLTGLVASLDDAGPASIELGRPGDDIWWNAPPRLSTWT